MIFHSSPLEICFQKKLAKKNNNFASWPNPLSVHQTAMTPPSQTKTKAQFGIHELDKNQNCWTEHDWCAIRWSTIRNDTIRQQVEKKIDGMPMKMEWNVKFQNGTGIGWTYRFDSNGNPFKRIHRWQTLACTSTTLRSLTALTRHPIQLFKSGERDWKIWFENERNVILFGDAIAHHYGDRWGWCENARN